VVSAQATHHRQLFLLPLHQMHSQVALRSLLARRRPWPMIPILLPRPPFLRRRYRRPPRHRFTMGQILALRKVSLARPLAALFSLAPLLLLKVKKATTLLSAVVSVMAAVVAVAVTAVAAPVVVVLAAAAAAAASFRAVFRLGAG